MEMLGNLDLILFTRHWARGRGLSLGWQEKQPGPQIFVVNFILKTH